MQNDALARAGQSERCEFSVAGSQCIEAKGHLCAHKLEFGGLVQTSAPVSEAELREELYRELLRCLWTEEMNCDEATDAILAAFDVRRKVRT